MSKQQSGMIVGQKGVQYGLQKVVAKKPGLAGSQPQQRKGSTANVFGDDESDEEDVERQIARQADKKRAAAKVQHMYEEALAEDPSVFDYDGVYDSIQEARAVPKQQDKVQRQSKYIASLLEQAQQRKREQDVLYERRMVRERQQEDHLYEGKERFVTNAYRRKLEEDKKWLEAERQKELEEQRDDVRKVGHMGNFYANLLTKNVAYGASKHEDTHDGPRQAAPEAAEALEGDLDGAPSAGGRAQPSPSREGSPAAGFSAGGSGSGADKEARGAAGPSAKVLSQLDRYDILRLEAERALRQRRHEGGQGKGEEAGPGGAGTRPRSASPQGESAGPPQAERGDQRPGIVERGRLQAEEPADAVQSADVERAAGGGGVTAVAAAPAGKRRNDEGAVQSARERYLARRQQKTG